MLSPTDTLRRSASFDPRLQCAGEEASEVPHGGWFTPAEVSRIVRYVDANIHTVICNDELAGLLALSSGHFARRFKAEFGATTRCWITGRRIQHAKRLMLEGQARLCDVAAVCGFTDQAHFTHVFRRYVGMTPSLWRRAQTERLRQAA